MRKQSLLFLLLLLIISGCSTTDSPQTHKSDEEMVELTISAAASLQDALSDIKAAFEKDYPHVSINYNFGGSGALQQQIAHGAPVDLFISASKENFNQLIQDGIIKRTQSVDLVGNELVLIIPKDSSVRISKFAELPKADKISIGIPESVPVGQYAIETFKQLHIWPDIKGKVIYAKDVRQVLTYVETQNVDAGIVYTTDAMVSRKVKIAATAKERTHTPIIYPAGIIKNNSHPKEALEFFEFLNTDASMKIFEKYGFKRLPSL
ncbi:molybdate ABC transporter substrate-binding protein [Bacillus rubiinfantis]|uniref:molybdate ABC transporter substrate-binding protein n=1 Tax=Bacillus rubiinfantis TaxID=1499680 RepID=UPI0005A9B4FA|nr:molybdate ABC transporter substrate-binding protein [Bacillus rubiinfantis]